MAVRDKMRSNAEPLLDRDETIQAVFGATTTHPMLGLPFALFFVVPGALIYMLFVNKNIVVVVTDKRILVTRSGRFTSTPVNEVLHELPRSTRIGPARGIYRCDRLGRRLYINKGFHGDIAAADDAAPEAADLSREPDE